MMVNKYVSDYDGEYVVSGIVVKNGRKHQDRFWIPHTVPNSDHTKVAYVVGNGRSRVDYSTIDLKSNIDIKWASTEDMEHDLRQWLEAVFSASGPQLMREVGLALKEIGVSAIKDGDVGGEDRPAGAATKFD